MQDKKSIVQRNKTNLKQTKRQHETEGTKAWNPRTLYKTRVGSGTPEG